MTEVTAGNTGPSNGLKRRSVTLRALAIAWPAVMVVMVATVAVDIGVEWAYAPNRRAIDTIMGAIGKGMPRREVERLALQYESHFFDRQETAGELVCRAHANAFHAWVLRVTFSADQRLSSATVRSDDGSHPRTAPPDIR